MQNSHEYYMKINRSSYHQSYKSSFLMQWALLILSIVFFVSSCRLEYKPLSEDLGYSIKYIDKNKYRIEYYAPTKFEYQHIDNLLLKFATDICDSEFSLEKFKEEIVAKPLEFQSDKNAQKIKVVSSILKCTTLNQLMLENPSFTYP